LLLIIAFLGLRQGVLVKVPVPIASVHQNNRDGSKNSKKKQRVWRKVMGMTNSS